ncbi:4117_t:CDS:2, partial [Ambispora gerdemannii]
MSYENFLRTVDSFDSQSRVDQDIRVEISGNYVVNVRESTEIKIEPDNDTAIADDNKLTIVAITDDNEFTLIGNQHNLDRNKSLSENPMNYTKEFNASSSSANNWIGSVNLITSVATTPIFGKLSDIFDRKNIFIVVLGTFTIGSVFCGVSRNIAMIIIGRIISGIAIGAGGMTTLSSTITSEIVYVKSRGIYQGILSYTGCAQAHITSIARCLQRHLLQHEQHELSSLPSSIGGL